MRIAASPARRGGGRSRSAPVFAVAVALLLLASVIAAVFWARSISKPVVLAIDPPIGEPGVVLRIKGRNFGQERAEGRVEFDRRVPTTSSYLTWSDELIEVRMPMYADSSLVRVVTGKGTSNSRLFMSLSLLPVQPEAGSPAAIVPLVNA